MANAQNSNLTSVQSVLEGLDKKVDKVPGKGLSQNDLTNELLSKLNSIEGGAKTNVQADWNQTDQTADDYINNKPSIPILGEGKQEFILKDEPENEGQPKALGTFGANDTNNKTFVIDVANKLTKSVQASILYGTDTDGKQITYGVDSIQDIKDVIVDGVSVLENKTAKIDLTKKVDKQNIPTGKGQALISTNTSGMVAQTEGYLILDANLSLKKQHAQTGLQVSLTSTVEQDTVLRMGSGLIDLKKQGGDITVYSDSDQASTVILKGGQETKLTQGTMARNEDKTISWGGQTGEVSHTNYPSEMLVYSSLYGEKGTPNNPTKGGLQPYSKSLVKAKEAFQGPDVTNPRDNGSIYMPANTPIYGIDGTTEVKILSYEFDGANNDNILVGNSSKATVLNGQSGPVQNGGKVSYPKVYLGTNGTVKNNVNEDARVLPKAEIERIVKESVSGTAKFQGVFDYFGTKEDIQSNIGNHTYAQGQIALGTMPADTEGWNYGRYDGGTWIWTSELPNGETHMDNGDWIEAKSYVRHGVAPKQRVTQYYSKVDGNLPPTFSTIMTEFHGADENTISVNTNGEHTFKTKTSGTKEVLNTTDADNILMNGQIEGRTIKDEIEDRVKISQPTLPRRLAITNNEGNIDFNFYPQLQEMPTNPGDYALKLTIDNNGHPSFYWEPVTDTLKPLV